MSASNKTAKKTTLPADGRTISAVIMDEITRGQDAGASSEPKASAVDKVTVYDLMDILGVSYSTACEKMSNYKRILTAAKRDVSNMQAAITIGDYCWVTGITVPDLIAWREYMRSIGRYPARGRA